jgi:hypothetical protein
VYKKAVLLDTGEELSVTETDKGSSVFVKQVHVFRIIQFSK